MNGNKKIYKMDEEIDINLYSSQIGTIAMEKKKNNSFKSFNSGTTWFRNRNCKKYYLTGTNGVSLFDPEFVNINDLVSNFYLTEEDIKNHKRRMKPVYKNYQN